MGALAGVINGVVGSAVGAAVGNKSIGTDPSTLDDFLSHFSSSDSAYIKKIDPKSTFDVSFRFYPDNTDVNAAGESGTTSKASSYLSKLGNKLATSATSSLKNALNSATGGLWSSLMGTFSSSIAEAREGFVDKSKNQTFLSYLAAANMLVTDNYSGLFGASAAQTPLELDLTFYTQSITVPQIRMNSSPDVEVPFVGKFPTTGTFCFPDSNTLQLTLINTVVPLAERIFYPWMKEVTLPYWMYDSQPYTTATVTIDFSRHSDIKYVFTGCRPGQIDMMQPSQQQQGNNITRQVTLLFDYMFVMSGMQVTESLVNKIASTGQSLVNSAAKLVNA